MNATPSLQLVGNLVINELIILEILRIILQYFQMLLYFPDPCDFHPPVCVHWLYDWTYSLCGRHDCQLHGEQGKMWHHESLCSKDKLLIL